MKLNQLLTHSSTLNLHARTLLDKKNQDYSNEDNVHANFEDMCMMCYVLDINVQEARGCIMFEIVKKIRRLWKIIKSNRNPVNESLKDSVVDLHNYIDLLYTLVIDSE